MTVANPWQPLLLEAFAAVEVDDDVVDITDTLDCVSAICDFDVTDLERHERQSLQHSAVS